MFKSSHGFLMYSFLPFFLGGPSVIFQAFYNCQTKTSKLPLLLCLYVCGGQTDTHGLTA